MSDTTTPTPQAQEGMIAMLQEMANVGDPNVCRHILEAHNWNMEGAANDLLQNNDMGSGGDTANNSGSEDDLTVPVGTPSDTHGSEIGMAETRQTSNEVQQDQAADQNQGGGGGWGSWIPGSGIVRAGLGVVGTVAGAGIGVVSAVAGVVLGGGGEEGSQNPRIEFKNQFESEYGTVHPTFFEGSYAQCVEAAKTQHKFLVIYLHSDLHQDTENFCRNTIATDTIQSFVDENMLFWAGSVTEPEAYKVSHILKVSGYPYIGVLSTYPRNELIYRSEGLVEIEPLMTSLAGLLESHGHLNVASSLESQERNSARRLREEQDMEFQRALEEERAKEESLAAEKRREEEEEERLRREEEEAARKEEELRLAKISKRESLAPEPEDGPGIHVISVRFADGTSQQRRFREDDQLQVVADWVSTNEAVGTHSFRLMKSFPVAQVDLSKTIKEEQLAKKERLMVQEDEE